MSRLPGQATFKVRLPGQLLYYKNFCVVTSGLGGRLGMWPGFLSRTYAEHARISASPDLAARIYN